MWSLSGGHPAAHNLGGEDPRRGRGGRGAGRGGAEAPIFPGGRRGSRLALVFPFGRCDAFSCSDIIFWSCIIVSLNVEREPTPSLTAATYVFM